MKILSPLCITSRLLPGVEIGGATISIEYARVASDGRQVYRWFIDLHHPSEAEFQGDRLVSGSSRSSLQDGLETLLGFLSDFAEANANASTDEDQGPWENAVIFPFELAKWAVTNADEISALVCELEENPRKFIIEN